MGWNERASERLLHLLKLVLCLIAFTVTLTGNPSPEVGLFHSGYNDAEGTMNLLERLRRSAEKYAF